MRSVIICFKYYRKVTLKHFIVVEKPYRTLVLFEVEVLFAAKPKHGFDDDGGIKKRKPPVTVSSI